MLSKKWLGSDTLRAMSEKYNALIDLLKGSDEVYQTTFARKLTKIFPGNGLQGGGTLEEDRTLSVKTADDGMIADPHGLRLNLIQVLTSTSTTQAVSGIVAKTLNDRINAIVSGGEVRLMRVSEVYGDMAYEVPLPSGQVLISVGKALFRPKLFIDGTLIPKSWYTVDLTTGTFTLSEPYSDSEKLPDYIAKCNILDEFENAIKFSYPTLAGLVASDDMKSRIAIGDVVQILGATESFDGGDFKVKCSLTEGLNGVNIGTLEAPVWLNEVPNSRAESLKADIEQNKLDILKKANILDIINDLVTGGANKMLSAEQGKVLLGEIAKTEIGYKMFPDGLLVCWGVVKGNDYRDTPFPASYTTIPKVFPTTAFPTRLAGIGTSLYLPLVSGIDLFGFRLTPVYYSDATGFTAYSEDTNWLSIGW